MKNQRYEPHIIENFWYQVWEQNGYFTPRGGKDPYCIVVPPPNVTGTLHMGHGFQISIMDALIRYHRMQDCNTLWQLGTDHAGIATQMVVENIINGEGQIRHTLGREKFIERVWQWKEQSKNTITNQQRRLGVSGDWTREKFTLDPELITAVQHAFIQLYEEGLIYRGERLINWDPVLKTALSDLEVVSTDGEGLLWYIDYPLADGEEKITIATTRPETLLGDTAVAVHPQDIRYQHLIGKMVKLPLTDRLIPIIADESVMHDFGTGCVKITPAHDFNDYAMGQRHKLPAINIFTKDAHLNENAPLAYRGLERFAARQKILGDLTSLGLLVKTMKHSLKVPRGERSGFIVEPYLTNQWFVKARELAVPAMEALHSGQIRFIPEHWGKTYLQWLENIEDWCISRQLWWGHRIPAWYDEAGNIYVGSDGEQVRAKYSINGSLTQDEDVLDTWFSAALWPFSTLGWPDQTEGLATFYPTNVLVTGFDIIFFWVARMVMFGLKFTGKVPFRDIYITGLIRDSHGQKMSKSKGNILDPIDLADGISLEQLVAKRTSNLMQKYLTDSIAAQTKKEFPQGISGYGVDALRFTFCSLATTSRDINFDIAKLEGSRNFCTKLWNCARFIFMQLEDGLSDRPIEYTVADRWIESELNRTIKTVTSELHNYRFDLAIQAIYEFTWHQLCDWYLELVKPVLNSDQFSDSIKQGAHHMLAVTLEKLLRVIHPFMPFITEELWQQLAPQLSIARPSIMLESYPKCDETKVDLKTVGTIQWLKNIIIAIRNIRGEMNLAPTKPLTLLLRGGNVDDRQYLAAYEYHIKWLVKIAAIEWLADGDKIPHSASTVVGDLEIYLVIDEADLQAEKARLIKEIDSVQREIVLLTHKLDNPGYLAKAPEALVTKDREKLMVNQQLLNKFQAHLDKIT